MEIAQGCAHREKLSDIELGEVLETISGMSCHAARRELAIQYPESAELPKDRIRPLTADHSEVRFVASEALLEKLDEIRGLLAHSHPKISWGELIDHLATDYRERHHPEEKARRAQARADKKVTEKTTEMVEIPAATQFLDPVRLEHASKERTFSSTVKHALTVRDGYQCRYIDPITRKKCVSAFKLETDHVVPWALDGKTELTNARYLCLQHHRRISFLQFGESSRYFETK